MDPELKTLLKALMDGQIKLAEGHVETQAAIQRQAEKTEASIRSLAEKTEASIRSLAEKTEASISSLAKTVSLLSERLDSFGEKVVRGFTDVAQRDGDLERRVSKLESEVESLKNQPRQDI